MPRRAMCWRSACSAAATLAVSNRHPVRVPPVAVATAAAFGAS